MKFSLVMVTLSFLQLSNIALAHIGIESNPPKQFASRWLDFTKPELVLDKYPQETSSEVNSTYYSQLANRFNKSEFVAPKDITKYTIGRCFESFAPNLALNGILTVIKSESGNDTGPGFPPQEAAWFMATVHYYDRTGKALPANYFDQVDENILSSFDKLVLDLARSQEISPAQVQKGKLTYSFPKLGAEVSIRKYVDGSIITELKPSRVGATFYLASLGRNETFNNLSPIRYCYYFEAAN